MNANTTSTKRMAMAGCAVMAIAWGGAANASVYPANLCVSKKMKIAGTYCHSVLKAWSKWDKTQDATARDAALAVAAAHASAAWLNADAQSSTKGVDCAETTLSYSALQSAVDAAVSSAVTQINSGLDLGDTNQARCGSRLLAAAANDCAGLLSAESKLVKKLDKDPQRTTHDMRKANAEQHFALVWNAAAAHNCPTGATELDIKSVVDTLSDNVVTSTTVSPNVDDTQFTTISPVGTTTYEGRHYTPMCVDFGAYHFFVKRGSVNKLVMYYQGGGACWEQLTCSLQTCDTSVDPNGSDNPNNDSGGFADLSNPNNPFKDWNIVTVSYCSCDIHYGDASQDYTNTDPMHPTHIEHRGFENAKVVEKWARDHFVNPDVVFVTGSSAGAYGALFHAPLLEQVWPASQFNVLGDAGNGVITAEFLQNEFDHWNFRANLPPTIPGVIDSIDNGTGMVGYIEAVARFFPETRWAHYATAYDGGSGGQTGFYNVMLNGNDPIAALSWWDGSCTFNQKMVQQVTDTVTQVATENNNYRYYIGSGSRHTMWGSDKVYGDTTGGVPPLVDWVNAMLVGGPGWGNIQADPFNLLLPGDPAPSPLAPPFEMSGSDIVVNCP